MSNVHILSKKPDIAGYYDDLAQKHGSGYKSADAGSQESLNARYKVLSEVADLNDKTVLEVGCGTGNLGNYLIKKYPKIKYTGIDISNKCIEVGKKEYPDLNLIHADLCDYQPLGPLTGKPKQYDIILSQGLFYKLPVTKEGVNKVFELITHMVRLSKGTIAFTGVSTHPFGDSKTELRLEPHAILEFVTKFSPFITMKMHYWPGDVCFTVYREKQGD